MTEPLPSLNHDAKAAIENRKSWSRMTLTFLIALAAMTVLVGYLRQQASQTETFKPQASAVSVVTQPIAPPPAQPVPASDAPAAASATVTADEEVSAEKIGELQKSVATLTATVAVLQNELQHKQSEQDRVTQNSTLLAATLAFIDLRDRAEAGEVFADELQMLQATGHALPDGIQQPIRVLETYSTNPAPNLGTLQMQLRRQEPAALHALAKHDATTWTERLKAALLNIVSIRKLDDPAAPQLFAPLEKALRMGDMVAALKAFQDLPQPAQDVLDGWHKDAIARDAIDDALHDVMNGLIKLSITAPASAGDSKP